MIKQNMSESGDNSIKKFSISFFALLMMLAMVLSVVSVKADVGNPELSESCGIDIVLVLDSSDSIDDDEIQEVKDAANAFVTSLSGTPTNFGVVDFDTEIVSFLALTSDTSAVTAAIDSIGHDSSFELTNWHAAITEGKNILNTSSPKQDLMVIITDGDPTTYGYPTSQGSYGGPEPDPNDINFAIQAADSAKTAGIRILAIGVTASPTVSNLIDISGPNVNTGNLTSDVITTDISGLADTLANLASQLCGGTITVQKFIDGEPAKNWEFIVNVTGGTADPSFGFTDDNGYIVFDISISAGNTTAYVDITEIQQGGYSFVDAIAWNCSGQISTDNGVDSLLDVPVTQEGCPITCVFNNTDSNDPPSFETPNPANGSLGQDISLTWSINIEDPDGNDFNWTIECNNGQSNSTNNDSNGTKELALSGLDYGITYTIWVNATDAYGTTEEWFNFTTRSTPPNAPPMFSGITPSNGSTDVSISTSSLSVTIQDPEGELMNWTIEASTGDSNNSSSSVGNGTISCNLTTPLSYDTNVIWYVNATDGLDWTNRTYSFTVESAPPDDNDNPGSSPGTPPQTNEDPVADAGGPYEGYIGVEVTFNGSKSSDDGTIKNYTWDFGDDTFGYEKIATHTYMKIGLYNVTLTVKDNKGATDENKTTADIRNPPNNNPIDPIIDGPTNGTVDVGYIFNISSTDEDNDPIRYIIDWGDNTTYISDFLPSGEILMVNHSWNSSGDYTIIAQADDNKTLSGETEVNMTIEKEDVEPPPEDNIFWLITTIMSLFLFMGPVGLIIRRKSL